MEWINVEDKLPDFENEVLCYWEELEGGIAVGKLIEVSYRHNEIGENCSREWEVFTSVGRMSFDVTYWMPLPENPIE